MITRFRGSRYLFETSPGRYSAGMKRFLPIVLLAGSFVVSADDCDDAEVAYKTSDFETATELFMPYARTAHCPAHYILVKSYDKSGTCIAACRWYEKVLMEIL